MDREKRDEIIRRLRIHGETLSEIGELFGISRQRVDQILDRKKENARSATLTAIAAGRLDRPDTCEGCGRAVDVEAHHHDYDRPLDVTFLCVPCHRGEHAGQERDIGPYVGYMGKVDPDTIGGRVRARRIELRMTQEDLADVMDTHAPAISYYETGTNDPRAESLKKLAEALCCSTDWLLFGHEDPEARDVVNPDEAA